MREREPILMEVTSGDRAGEKQERVKGGRREREKRNQVEIDFRWVFLHGLLGFLKPK